MENRSGFTTIELLVAIAIAVVLAIIIMINVFGYINKGKDATIRSEVDSFRRIATEFFLTNKKYSNLCEEEANPQGRDILDKIDNEKCHSDAEGWVLCAPLFSSNEVAWCADDTGVNRGIDSDDCRPGIKFCPESVGVGQPAGGNPGGGGPGGGGDKLQGGPKK